MIGTARVVNGKIEFTPGDELDKLKVADTEEVSFEYTVTDGKKV